MKKKSVKNMKKKKSKLTTSIKVSMVTEEEYRIATGELIDRLCIVNLKMWHADEKMAKAKEAGDKDMVADCAIIARELNADRSDLREEINRRLDGIGKGTNKIEYALGRGQGLKK